MSKTISRRHLIGAAASTALGSAVLAGCVAAAVPAGPPPPGPPPPPPGPPPPPPGPPPPEAQGGGYGGAGARPMTKQTKEEARYQNHPNGQQRCGLCANFIPPDDCRVIQGPVSPDGWCRNFRAKA